MDVWELENRWYQEAPVQRLAKAIAQYEVARTALAVPGAIAEFGVFKGTSLIRLATFRDLLEPKGGRTIYGFDAFGGFPPPAASDDTEWSLAWERRAGVGLPRSEMAAVVERKGFANVVLIEGDIRSTLPRFLRERSDMFSLVHVDVDVEDVTQTVLECCADRLSVGGIFMLDDYRKIAGATRAVEAFAASRRDYSLVPPLVPHGPYLLRRDHAGGDSDDGLD